MKLNSCSSRPETWSTSGTWRWWRMEYAEKFSVTSQKLVFRLGLRPAPLHAGFGVADDATGAIDHTGLHEGADGQIGGGGVTAGIGDQARVGDKPAAEFRQTVDRLGEKFGLGVGLLVPGCVVFGSAQPEGAAEIYDTCTGAKHDGSQFHGNFRGSGQENDGEPRLVYGFAGTGNARRRCGAADGGGDGLFPMIHQDWLHL